MDATNIRRGGGVTHLAELLSAADPARHNIARVVVWGGKATLARLPRRPWLELVSPPDLDRGLFRRIWWQRTKLSQSARAAGCAVLFVPGGSFAGNFHPVVAMSQNLLPFEARELRRYGVSLATLKFLLLRQVQKRTFRAADAVVFLTRYAEQAVTKVTGTLRGRTATIAHGIGQRFRFPARPQEPIGAYSVQHPFRLLYVSIIDLYKHQDKVAEAVASLRALGYPLHLDLVGPSYAPALRALDTVLDKVDPDRSWARYLGAIDHDVLGATYREANLGIFASTCENLPIILLEAMAAGLPIACSASGPMPEVLGTAGTYFDPENPASIADAIRALIDSAELRQASASASVERASTYSWEKCADETFAFLASVARQRAARGQVGDQS